MICKVCQVLVMISFMVFPYSVASWAIQAEYSGAGSLFSEGWSLKRDVYSSWSQWVIELSTFVPIHQTTHHFIGVVRYHANIR